MHRIRPPTEMTCLGPCHTVDRPRWRTRCTQAQVGGDSESGPLSLRVSGPAGHRYHRTRLSRARSACPVGNVTACKQRVNFELALKLEVDPAARRPCVTVTPPTVLRLPEPSATVPGPAVWSRSRRHGATSSTGQCLGQRQV
jgi:hypothetical protein